ncbi:MAG: VCBS repeat-containing protein, partial [Candidatus Woesearchaeota archaeon]
MTKKKTTRAVEREYKNRIKKEMSKNFLIVIFILWLILIFSLANTTKTSQVSSSKITGFTIGERPEQQVIKIKKIITEKTEILLSDYNIYNITSLHISGNYKELNKNTIIKIYLTTDLEKYLVYELQQERIDKNNKTISENIITDYIINKTKDEEQTLINNINNKKDNIEETEDNKEEHNININETTNIEKNSVEEEIKEIDFFDDEKTYYFENECLETCKIEAKNGKLVIEIENATLSIDKIIYTTHITRDNKYYPAHNASQLEKEVIQTKKIPDQYTTINQTISINLSEFFYESNLTGLTFDYRKIEYVTTKIDNFSISYTPEKEGIYNTYIYAMNKISIVRSNIFSIIVNNTYYNNNITDINITNVTTKTDTKNDNITINKTTNITINQTNTTINISQINTAYIRNITAIDYDNENLEFLKIKFAYNNIIFKNLTKVTITTIAADNITENTAKEEHTLEIKSEDNSSEVKIEGITKIRNITKIRFFNKTKDERITTDIFAINSIEITNATIKLKTKGHVKNIYKCEEYDFDIEECPNWQITDIPFSEENDTITFTINHFTAYAGGGSGETQANLTVWDSTDTGMPYADMTLYTNESIFIYANYTNFTNEIISGNCIIKYYNNIFNMSFNYTKNIYEYNLHADITYHGIHDFTINCSSTQYTNLSATDSYTIQNYTTTINTTNTTGIILGQKAKFVANYSSEKTGSIGRTIWRGGRTTPTNDIISVAFFDCNGDGKKRCIALGDYALILFNYTFQSISVNPYSEGSVYDIKILDLNKDGRDEIITAKHNGIFVYYSNGSEWWRAYNTTSSPFNYIAYGDINNDSYYELAFGQTYDDRIIVFNYSGVELWNYTKPNVAAHAYRGLVIGNFSNNGKIAYAKHYGGYGIINYTGSEIWSPTNQTSGDINIINLDNDTYDELVVYSDGLRAFDDDGTSLWTIPQIVNANYEIEVTDIDNDGMTEIIYQDGNYILVYNANLTTTLQKWNYTQTSTNNEYFAMAITSKDINDDPIKETMFGGIDNTTFVFDEEGNILYEFYVYGTVG